MMSGYVFIIDVTMTLCLTEWHKFNIRIQRSYSVDMKSGCHSATL
jgi:hypothetical protein